MTYKTEIEANHAAIKACCTLGEVMKGYLLDTVMRPDGCFVLVLIRKSDDKFYIV